MDDGRVAEAIEIRLDEGSVRLLSEITYVWIM